ncbi:hypothetical protein PghCCS26_47190 [Paenibacillus glycanilyticus]|uniref:Uncharacterized protein n=1 Tax=Paenibacillus glycanilyticus TaxID=126569 RepID=A0ABQ6NS35_9BACL|nr:hypothetical protein [Paenibacillus glycanilyticus]GMK47589.1 hypothetical protein PghCCS26_47190 [Paenibacillus glycanilyticus]
MPRKKSEPKPKINRSDWRNLPDSEWNVRTFHAYFSDMNAECYGSSPYLPRRNWAFEQGALKRAIAEHGAELLRQAFDECFRTYRPTREYPILTAGFCIAYRINGIIPGLVAKKAEEERRAAELQKESVSYSEVAAWL